MTHYWKQSVLVAVSEYTRKQLFSWVLRGNHSLYPLQCTQLSWEPWAIENGQRAQGFRRTHTVPTVSFQCPKMWESVLSRQSRGPHSSAAAPSSTALPLVSSSVLAVSVFLQCVSTLYPLVAPCHLSPPQLLWRSVHHHTRQDSEGYPYLLLAMFNSVTVFEKALWHQRLLAVLQIFC